METRSCPKCSLLMKRCDFKYCPDCGAQLNSLCPSDATACSPREPIRLAYSREELAAKMAGWLVDTYGHPMELTEVSRDRWMERNGMLYAFICDHFPAENAASLPPETSERSEP